MRPRYVPALVSTPAPRLRRPVTVVSTLALLLGTFALGLTVGRGADRGPDGDRGTAGGAAGAAGPGGTRGDGTRLASTSALRPAQDCDDLLAYLHRRGRDAMTAYGWNDGGSGYVPQSGVFPATFEARLTGAVPVSGRAAPLGESTGLDHAQGSSATGTNVQEAGVDEADVVKTDGRVLVRVLPSRGSGLDTLAVYDVAGEQPRQTARLVLPDLAGSELLLVGDRVVAVGREREQGAAGYRGWGVDWDRGWPGAAPATTRVVTVDVADTDAPEVVDAFTLDSPVTRVLQHQGSVRLVVGHALPVLDTRTPRRNQRSRDAALARNRALVDATTVDDWFPRITTAETTDAGREETTRPLVDCTRIGVPARDSRLGTTTVVGLDPADPTTRTVTGLAAAASTAYASGDRLWLATQSWPRRADGTAGRTTWDNAGPGRATELHGFALDGAATAYRATGRVRGLVQDPWAFDAPGDGTLRVAVTEQETVTRTVQRRVRRDGVVRLVPREVRRQVPTSSVVVLAERGDAVVETGRVDDLGRGEQIQSVRWFDDVALLVTFRQVDPFYAVDLSDPAEPVLAGELKLPGFSAYLHPVGGDRVLGIGQDATLRGRLLGGTAQLFDVADLTAPRRTSAVRWPRDSQPLPGGPRQFTWLGGVTGDGSDGSGLATVVVNAWGSDPGRGPFVAVLRVDGGRVAELRRVDLPREAGWDGTTRVVPLPTGPNQDLTAPRALLVSDAGVSALDLDTPTD